VHNNTRGLFQPMLLVLWSICLLGIQLNCAETAEPIWRETRRPRWMGMGCTCSSAGTIFSLGGWVDSIRQVDVYLNFLLVLYSTVGLYRLVCLFGRLDICWKIFRVGRIHWLPTQCYSWVGNCPPCPLGSRAYMHMVSSIQLLYLRVAVMETYVKFLFDLSL